MRIGVPEDIDADLRKARRLELWTIFWLLSIIVVMGLAMGSSQAMRTAWIEDMLSLVPSIVFLIALHFERREPTAKYPYGFFRINSLAFLIAATALTGLGLMLLFEAVSTLLKAEHPTIAPVHLFGHDIWLGWLMIAALAYSVIPPIILGRLKLPVARRLWDKVLFTDAMTQKADWTTALAGIVGILGVGLGFWWADAVAAGFISISILRDGLGELKLAAAELADGTPRALDSDEIAEDARALEEALQGHFPGCKVMMRETGRYIIAHVTGARAPDPALPLEHYWPGSDDTAWRLAGISFDPGDEREA